MNEELLDDDLELDLTDLSNDRIREINLVKIDANENMRDVRYGRNALWVLCAITFIFTGIGLMNNPSAVGMTEIVLERLIFIGIYGTCAYCVKFNPKVALIVGLSIYVLLITLNAFLDFRTIFSAMLLKLLMIYYLAKGVKAAIRLARDKIKLRGFGIPSSELENIQLLKDIPKTIKALPGSN